SPRELVARIGAILRRSGWQSEGSNALRPPVIRSGDVELDPSARAASRAGQVLHLTSAEYDILRLFVESPGQVLTREKLVEDVLDRKFSPFDRSIDLHVSNLRKKLGPHADGTESSQYPGYRVSVYLANLKSARNMIMPVSAPHRREHSNSGVRQKICIG